MKTEGIIISQTPFRLSFFGGGTDFPGYFNDHGGLVIAAAINKYLYVTINSLQRFYEKRIRLSYSKLEFVDRLGDLLHPQVKAILTDHRFFSDESFLDMHTYADFPASSGMGSSSAFTVGFLKALYSLHNFYVTPEELAKESIYFERVKLQEAGGWQDQITPAFGGFNLIRFQANQFTVEPILLSLEKRKALETSCLLFFTGGMRSSAAIQEQSLNLNHDEKLQQLHTIQKQAKCALDVLQNTPNAQELIQEFGRLLNVSWEAKRNLSNAVSNSHVDAMYETALKAGAIGGKLCGAGGSGFLLTIVASEKKQKVIDALNQFKHIEIQFDDAGTRIVYGHLRK